MSKITYEEAAQLLHTTENTVKQAVYRGYLTRCAQPRRPAMLLKEQVCLFSGKGKISKSSFSSAEYALWEMYKEQASKDLVAKKQVLPQEEHTTSTSIEAVIDRHIETKLEKDLSVFIQRMNKALEDALKPQPLDRGYL